MTDPYDPYDDYFNSGRRDYRLVAVKRVWIPEWVFRIAAVLDPEGNWIARWCCEAVK